MKHKDWIFSSLAQWGMELIFPRRCPVCGQIVQPSGELICATCFLQLSPVKSPVCRKCGKEVLGDHYEYCPDCMRRQRTFDSGMALFNYNEAARRSMAAIKYKNRREYLDFYGAALSRRFSKIVGHWQADCLIPVPIHPSRRRQRGFNQAEELAKRLEKSWNIPVCSQILIRNRKTVPQRDLNPSERLKNLREAFRLHPDCCKNLVHFFPKTVILIDDIYTTGSTIEACARVLKAAGVQRVYFLVVCIGTAK